MMAAVSVNGRDYAAPKNPTVVICIDGSEPGYIEKAIEAGVAPNFARMMREGSSMIAECVIPSFTNPNNLSIITGRPPEVHGIAGNFFYDPATGTEVMMNDPSFLRVPTILAGVQQAGFKVAMVTAKDKLRLLLSKGLDYSRGTAIAFSSEKAEKANKGENGIEKVCDFVGMGVPDVYSASLSEFVFAAGVKLAETFKPDLMYLSTTDYIQHKAAPGTKIANDFYAMIDRYLGLLDALGWTILATADHGMNDKHLADKSPSVVYLEPLFESWLGKGRARVILPITDPYVVHHGALGSFATVYLPEGADRAALIARLKLISGVQVAMTREAACAEFELPPDRLGDLVVISTRHVTLGTAPEKHDLSGLTEPLRSHGGLTEQRVPMISNRKLKIPAGHRLRSFDAFWVALNCVEA
ncbi:MAG: phosphonoacetate hydrolase [Methylobacterium sp.]|nr:phosphonoacetate hydrolase [Methylobacterium sp.]MCA3654950.1 phosphonoacetate hydrolase [Methylobacterium sp.]MCA3657390.1 phosphonoacetate hydrolase [Methylobacterium sp.]MCA3662286.1 phosphonoacetate hydrolase [Methylobacterium sp.]MCA3666188.1 phosphonoacetate hydrolase [Methylobacterium sp.]